MEYILARTWLTLGDLEKPYQHVQKKGIKIKDEISFRRGFEYELLLRVLIARGEFEAAIILSNRLVQHAETTGHIRFLIEVLILQALALQGKKESGQALTALDRALALAQPEGYVRSFLDEGEAMTKLLCQAQAHQVGSGYAAVLLSKIDKTAGMTLPSMQLLAEPLTSREVEVLKLIKAGCSNQDIAGQLVISLPTVKRHISNIYTKLGVESRTQAVAIGKELKIFE
jgi:LuxR family maltose regulon positive regulatory protein